MEVFSKNSNQLKVINPICAKITKWSNTLKQFVGKLPTNCLSVFDHFVGLALKWLTIVAKSSIFDIWQEPKYVSMNKFLPRPYPISVRTKEITPVLCIH